MNKPIIYCELCGQPIDYPTAIILDNYYICHQCKNFMGTCALCTNVNKCDFETNPSPIPKVIQQQVRQGNMIAVTQVRNPKRIEITCKQNCPCFDSEIGCLREYNTCGQYKYIKEKEGTANG